MTLITNNYSATAQLFPVFSIPSHLPLIEAQPLFLSQKTTRHQAKYLYKIFQVFANTLSNANSFLSMQPLKPSLEKGACLFVDLFKNCLLSAHGPEVGAISKTVALSLIMASYGVFASSFSSSLEKCPSSLLLVLWWSSSTFVEFIGYDFFRSCFADHFGENNKITKLLPSYSHHSELQNLFQKNKSCFYLCAFMIMTCYAFVSCKIPKYLPALLHQTGLCDSSNAPQFLC